MCGYPPLDGIPMAHNQTSKNMSGIYLCMKCMSESDRMSEFLYSPLMVSSASTSMFDYPPLDSVRMAHNQTLT
jgi:hypothetical protein